jgi:hypothetical protein
MGCEGIEGWPQGLKRQEYQRLQIESQRNCAATYYVLHDEEDDEETNSSTKTNAGADDWDAT